MAKGRAARLKAPAASVKAPQRKIAKVFQSGNSQAIRLPKEFRLKGPEVEIFGREGELVIREKPRSTKDIIAFIQQMPEDMFEGIRDTRPPEKREEL